MLIISIFIERICVHVILDWYGRNDKERQRLDNSYIVNDNILNGWKHIYNITTCNFVITPTKKKSKVMRTHLFGFLNYEK